MAEKKSILEEALLDIKNIENALNANTKEILRSVAKEEIDSVVKESLDEEIYEEETLEEASHAEHEKSESKEKEKAEHEKGEEAKEKKEVTEAYEEEGLDMNMEDEVEMGVEAPEVTNMVGSSDEEIFDMYKKITSQDGFEIVGDEVHINITEPGEYIIKLDSLKDVENDEEDFGSDEFASDDSDEEDLTVIGGDDSEEEEDTEYNIELDDEDSEEEAGEEAGEEDEEETNLIAANDDSEEEEDELEESQALAHAHGKKYSGGRTLAPESEKESLQEVQKARQIVSETAKKYNSLLTEAKKLKTENQEFRTALKEFRTKLVETVVFNSNLTYITRLFTEHSTTKAEKQSILKRFDQASNLVESKKLYKVISNELETRKPITESLENKLIKESTTSTSKQLNESTAYVDPSTQRIKDLINRVEKR
jgi:hypothetical protein